MEGERPAPGDERDDVLKPMLCAGLCQTLQQANLHNYVNATEELCHGWLGA
jgi:hypothetical protein